MSTYVLMRILESAPRRYELGIRLLTLGGLDKACERLTNHIERGQQVLDLGCGTGALTVRAAQRGAKVKGIDIKMWWHLMQSEGSNLTCWASEKS